MSDFVRRRTKCLSINPAFFPALVVLSWLCGSARDLIGQTRIKAVAVVEELRISAQTQNLSSIGNVVLGPDGSLLISQAQDGNIRLFSSGGKPGATIGRRGAGPSEFERISSFGWAGSEIWVYDGQIRRLTTFAVNGVLLNTVPIADAQTASETVGPLQGYQSLGFQLPGAGGTVLFRATSRAVEGVSQSWYVWGTQKGDLNRVVTRVPVNRCTVRSDNFGVVVPACPQDQSSPSPTGNRVVLLETTSTVAGSYRLTSFDMSGREVYRRDFSAPVRPMSSREKDSLANAMIKRVHERQGGRGGQIDATLKIAAAAIPAVWPVVKMLHVGNDGIVWLQMSQEGRKDGLREWRGYDADGKPRGSISLPADAQVLASDLMHVITLQTDTDGIESIVRYRLSQR